MVAIQQCPSCGSARIRRVRRTVNREWAGEKYKVPRLEFHVCPDCGEEIYSPEAVEKIQARSPAFRKRRLGTRKVG